MVGKQWLRQCLGLIGCCAFWIGLSGCDSWPPALQAEIEQLRVQIRTLTVEKSELQSQVDELTRTKRDLQAQVEELSRLTREKSILIAGLQRQLSAAHAKVPSSSRGQKGGNKPPQKSTARSPVKKSASSTHTR